MDTQNDEEVELNRLLDTFVKFHSLVFESEEQQAEVSQFDSIRREFYGLLKELCEEGKRVQILPKSETVEDDLIIDHSIGFYNGTFFHGSDPNNISVGFDLKEAQKLKILNS